MAAPSGDAAAGTGNVADEDGVAAGPETESERQAAPAAQAPATPPTPGPYDDLLCTICNLKACWMTPEAAGKPTTG